ncbi:MAG: hypothetical protein DME90_09340, partial [Verrucomicrobia bacterium]
GRSSIIASGDGLFAYVCGKRRTTGLRCEERNVIAGLVRGRVWQLGRGVASLGIGQLVILSEAKNLRSVVSLRRSSQ